MDDGKVKKQKVQRLIAADGLNSSPEGWVRTAFETACSGDAVKEKIRDISVYGYDGKRYKGSSIPSVVWSVSKPDIWFAGDYHKREMCQISFRLRQKQSRYIARLKEFVLDVLPEHINMYSSCFGLLEVERVSEIAFGVEPQFGSHEIGQQRRMIQSFWEIELGQGKEVLPHVAWVNILTANMCLSASGSAAAVFQRCHDIVNKYDSSHAIQVECYEMKNGSAIIALLPTFFDVPFGDNSGDFTAAFDVGNRGPFYEIHQWWRKSGIIM